MKDPDSLTGWYLRILSRNAKQLLSICNVIVADAYFSKESIVTGVISLEFNIISRFRDDVNLKYIYRGPKTGKKGRPQKFAGKVNLAELDMNIFREDVAFPVSNYDKASGHETEFSVLICYERVMKQTSQLASHNICFVSCATLVQLYLSFIYVDKPNSVFGFLKILSISKTTFSICIGCTFAYCSGI